MIDDPEWYDIYLVIVGNFRFKKIAVIKWRVGKKLIYLGYSTSD